MKAIELLTWLIKESIDTEGMDIIQVDSSFDFESFFGYQPDGNVPDGEYAYLYSDMVLDTDMDRLGEQTDDQVYTITTPMDDKKNGGNTVIYLFKLED
jgi:hypothetical protein